MANSFFPERTTTEIPYPQATRQYDSFEMSIDRRLHRGWSGRVSYTWSRLWGNYSGLAQSDENGRVAPNAGRMFDVPMTMFDQRGEAVYGVLATDRAASSEGQRAVRLSHRDEPRRPVVRVQRRTALQGGGVHSWSGGSSDVPSRPEQRRASAVFSVNSICISNTNGVLAVEPG